MPGNIRQRGKNLWEVSFEVSRDPATHRRRRRYISVRGTKKDAERALTEAVHQRDTGLEYLPGKITLGQYLDRWLKDYAAINVAESTFVRYEIAVRKHLKPHLGDIRLAALRPAHVQSLQSACFDEGLAPKTVQQHHRILSKALKHAVQWQLIPANPAAVIPAPRNEAAEMVALNRNQFERLLEAAEGTFLRNLIFLAVQTGARSGELAALRWTDIDFRHGRLSITRKVQRLPHRGLHYSSPKTHRSRRPLSLSTATVAMLKEHRARQVEHRLAVGPAYDDKDLVFAQPNGRTYEPNYISKRFDKLVATVPIPRVRFHDLRHTMATLMLSEGVPAKVVSERLGHASIHITLDIYSHVLPDMQRDAAEAMDRILKPKKTGEST